GDVPILFRFPAAPPFPSLRLCAPSPRAAQPAIEDRPPGRRGGNGDRGTGGKGTPGAPSSMRCQRALVSARRCFPALHEDWTQNRIQRNGSHPLEVVCTMGRLLRWILIGLGLIVVITATLRALVPSQPPGPVVAVIEVEGTIGARQE